MEVRVQSVKFDAAAKLIDFAKKKVGKLGRFFDGIIAADVTMSLTQDYDNKKVAIRLEIPGYDLMTEKQSATFEKAIVTEEVNTRNVITDVNGIEPLLQAVIDSTEKETTLPAETNPPDNNNDGQANNDTQGNTPSGTPTPPTGSNNSAENAGSASGASGGPMPGGPPPRSFFETLSWHGKLDPLNQHHQGLLLAINELYRFSKVHCGRQKAYKVFPVATGMILRTVYEQALRLRLMQISLWGPYLNTLPTGRGNVLPTLSSMENYINQNKQAVFPDQGMILTYDRVIAASHRDFLNANIHYPGNISVTSDSLEAISAAGMHALVQGIINLI